MVKGWGGFVGGSRFKSQWGQNLAIRNNKIHWFMNKKTMKDCSSFKKENQEYQIY